jgi:hypothetical protein
MSQNVHSLQVDAFAAVLGRRRGHPEDEADTVASARPRARAREDLARLKKSLIGADADPARALAALQTMAAHRTTTARPLDRHVCQALAHYSAEIAISETEATLATLLRDAHVCDHVFSAHVIEVHAPYQRNNHVHLWLEGHLYGAPENAPEIWLACNRTLPAHHARLLPRGHWAALNNKADNEQRRCPDCEDVLRSNSMLAGTHTVVGAFARLTPREHALIMRRFSGEVKEHSGHIHALPHHLHNTDRNVLTRVFADILSSNVPADVATLCALARAHRYVGALSLMADDTHDAQGAWLRRLGLSVTPALAQRLPLLTNNDITELLRRLYPPAYRERGWMALGDERAWQQWLSSREYKHACAQLPLAVAARVRTRRRRDDGHQGRH